MLEQHVLDAAALVCMMSQTGVSQLWYHSELMLILSI